ncbi:MAG: HAD family hydrolase [Spirochaeta sp.]
MQQLSERPRALMFDFDGTIADTRRLIISSYRQAFAQIGLDCPGDYEIGATIGIPLTSAFRVLTGQNDAVIDQAVQAYKDIYKRMGYGMVQAFPGMPELIRAASGFRLGIASSRSRVSLVGMLAHLGISDCFEIILSRDDVIGEKPLPEMLLTAASRLDLQPAQMAMIGDTSYDIEMGHAAGSATVAVTWGNHDREALVGTQPTRCVDTVSELGAVLGL